MKKQLLHNNSADNNKTITINILIILNKTMTINIYYYDQEQVN